MDVAQKYFFELHGYIHVPSVLTPAEVSQARALATALNEDGVEKVHGGLWLLQHRIFRTLLDHPRVSPLLEDICGDRSGAFHPLIDGKPSFRADHLDVHTPADGNLGSGGRGGKLHGGNGRLANQDPAMGAIGSVARAGNFFSDMIYYEKGADGRLANGLTAVAYELEDTVCNGGGFGCLAGSHRMGRPMPEETSGHIEVGGRTPSLSWILSFPVSLCQQPGALCLHVCSQALWTNAFTECRRGRAMLSSSPKVHAPVTTSWCLRF
jgi:hypothetical protein